MCHEGYWPLYVTEAEAVAVSPLGHADVHPIKGVDFYMPKGFDGALHAEHDAPWCPWHAKTLPPFPPPSPAQPPSPPPPMHAARLASRPTRCRCRCKWFSCSSSATLASSCAPRTMCVSWHLWYGSSRKQAVKTREPDAEQRKFFSL